MHPSKLSKMPLKQGKKTVAATVTAEVSEKIKRVATLKHWSVAQTIGLFIDAYWDKWVEDIGGDNTDSPPPKRKR